MATATMERVDEKADAASVENLSDWERARRFLPNDPLDVPFPEGERPLYYNPHFRQGGYHIHATDPVGGQTFPVGKVKAQSSRHRPRTPREEMWTREYLSDLLNGNNPDRWKGDNLPEEETWICADMACGFVTRNSRAAHDHQTKHKHQRRI